MAASNVKNAYAVLGLRKGVSVDEIKKAYVSLVKKFDPEKHTDRFMVIQNAFDKLKNPATRAKEDVRSFNFIDGDFFFTEDEKNDQPDAKLDRVIEELRQRHSSEGGEDLGKKLVQALMMRSYKKVQKKLWAEAIQDWQRILKIDPVHRRAKNNLLYSFITLGYSYANHQLFDEAIEVWSQAGQMNPDNHALIHNLALACENAGRLEEASRYWRETVKRWKEQLEREPENEYLKTCIIEALREHSVQEGDEESPPAEPSQAKQAEPTPGQAPRRAATPTPSATGPSAPPRGGGRNIEYYREILKLNPKDFEAQFQVASLLMKDHKWDEAVKELKDMHKKFPRNVEVLNLLGWAMLNGGKVDEAFMIWRKARAIEPKNVQINESLIKAHMTMGRTMREKGLFTPCLVHFKALMRYLPDNDEVHYEIAKTYQLKGDERSAYQEYNKVLKLNPKHKGARQGLSSLKLRR